MKLKTSYYGGGFLAERPDAPYHPWVLGVQGSPREMGAQAGFLLAPALRKLASGFLTPVYAQFGGWVPDGKSVPTPRQMAAGREVLWHTYKTYFEQPIRDTAPDLYEEIVGLSEGLAAAGSPVVLEDLLLGNCVPEIAEPCFYTGVAGPYGESHSLCSDMAAWGAATAGGRLIHGANYDYSTFNVLHRWTGVVVARPDRGHAFIAQCIPGRVGYYRGMNETGIIATEKTSQSADRNMREHPRIPHSMHMRLLIQHASTLAEAVDIMGRLLGTTGNNNLVSDAKVPSALEIQGSCTKTAVFHPEKGMDAYWNTNQYLAYPGYRGYRGENLARDQLYWFGVPPGEADTVEKWMEVMRRESAKRTFSWQRFERMGELIRERYGRIDVPAVIEILSSPPMSREVEGRQTLAPECEQLFGEKGPIVDLRLSSIFSVVFDAGDMTAHVAVGAEPAQRGMYWPISFPRFSRALQAIRDEDLTRDRDARHKDAMLAEAFS